MKVKAAILLLYLVFPRAVFRIYNHQEILPFYCIHRYMKFTGPALSALRINRFRLHCDFRLCTGVALSPLNHCRLFHPKIRATTSLAADG